MNDTQTQPNQQPLQDIDFLKVTDRLRASARREIARAEGWEVPIGKFLVGLGTEIVRTGEVA